MTERTFTICINETQQNILQNAMRGDLAVLRQFVTVENELFFEECELLSGMLEDLLESDADLNDFTL